MKKLGDLCANMGKYRDRNTGEEKNRWKNCGVLFERDDGSRVVKLETLPVGEFSGWLAVFEPKPAQNQPEQRQNTRPTRNPEGSSGGSAAPRTHGDFQDDDLPF